MCYSSSCEFFCSGPLRNDWASHGPYTFYIVVVTDVLYRITDSLSPTLPPSLFITHRSHKCQDYCSFIRLFFFYSRLRCVFAAFLGTTKRIPKRKQTTWSELNGECTVTDVVCGVRADLRVCCVPQVSYTGQRPSEQPANGRQEPSYEMI